ncbi:glycosyltransferase family 87 protein [Streptacidiphilus sp. N1-10]|uniref:Glycosyltransferase family 87 protein n=1 Tax=Streptacidiphilus jeojiensis TaxID=3229225 RepID=A0ABV6XEX7_9ACTN
MGSWAAWSRARWALLVWALTRLVLVAGSLKVGPFAAPGGLDYSVDRVYRPWSQVLRHGAFPVHDVSWQYPPGAAGPMLWPALVPFTDYGPAFICLCAVCDAAVMAMLLRAATRGRERERGRERGRSSAGCWVWALGLPLLWTTPWNRFDVMVTALAVAALLAASWRRLPAADIVFGVLVGLGALVKVWPVLLLVGTERGRRSRVSWAAAAATVGLGAVAFAATMPGAFGFLTAQRDRGIEFESLPALPFQLARHLGWSGRIGVHEGSTEFLGPWVGAVARVGEALSVAALAWLLWWRTRADRSAGQVLPDAAFTAVLLFVVTSRVLSPQYLVWLVGLAAVCLLRTGTSQRQPALLVLAACPLTAAVFPFLGRELVHGSIPATLLLTVRDLLLLAAALLSARRLWQATATGRRPSAADDRRPTAAPRAGRRPGSAAPAAASPARPAG